MSIKSFIPFILKLKILIVLILLSNINNINAIQQDISKDSLLLRINDLIFDTCQVNLHLKLAESSINQDINSRLYHINYALSLSEKLDFKIGIARSYLLQSQINTETGLIQMADIHFDKALKIYDETGQYSFKLKALKNNSIYHLQRLNYHLSLKYFKAYYISSKEYSSYPEDETYALAGIGYIYMRLNQIDSSLFYLNKSLRMAEEYNYRRMITKNIVNIAYTYALSGDHQMSYKYFKKVDIKRDSLTINQQKIYTYSLSVALLNTGNKEKALRYYNKANQIEPVLNDVNTNDVYIAEYKADSTFHNYTEALEIYQKYIDLKNTSLDNDYNSKLANFQVFYNLKKKQNDISNLKKKNEIVSLQNDQNRLVSIFLSIGFFIILILIIFIFRYIRIKSKSHRILQQKNYELLEQKNQLYAMNEEIRSQKEDLFEKNEELSETLSKLNFTQAQLIHADKMASVGTLAAGIASEVKKPLNQIKTGFEELKTLKKLKALNTNQKFEKAFEITKVGIERSSNILNALLTYTRHDNNEQIKADINELINYSLRMFKHELHTDITIEKNLSDIPAIYCYPNKIIQTFLNILKNAADALMEYKGENKRIFIKTELINSTGDKSIQITFNNTGEKIPKAKLKKVFDPFFTTKDPDKGSGLGLTIAYNTIKEHNGNINMLNVQGGVECKILLKVNV